jgi:hypothetical protein
LNKLVLNIEVQEFIKNYSEDVSKLAFTGSQFANVSVGELIQQIESRRKIGKKLPTWYNHSSIYYPPKLYLEQSSSEITAKYKASLIEGALLADITGGFGVDSFYFSEKFKKVDYFENNASLSEIAAYNFRILGKSNVDCYTANGLEGLSLKKYDTIYADPSRRHDAKGKVFYLKDCEPNIPENIRLLFDHCDTLLLKTSPMLDISLGLDELKFVPEIHIVAVENEVKELLWLLKNSFDGTPDIFAVNIVQGVSDTFRFKLGQKSEVSYRKPDKYLYEPNSALMKSGAFTVISESYDVYKLHKHTHLYTSASLIDFPGRRFKIDQIIPYTKASIREFLNVEKANITTRNFPESVDIIRKKWGIKDGGNRYLFFTTIEDNTKIILDCSKA